MKKLYLLFFIIFCSIHAVHAQLYIMKTNHGGCSQYVDGNHLYEDDFEYKIVSSDGNWICPIYETGEYLIFNQKPFAYYFASYKSETYSCSGPCGDYHSVGLTAQIVDDCQKSTGTAYGYSGPNTPFFEIMSNQVLTPPGVYNSFSDKIDLMAVGCTGNQRFFWEYKIDGSAFQKTNVGTGFNETYEFVKSNFLPSSYSGNIDFRVVIDSDPSITGENVYSNVISYNIIPSSPNLVGEPLKTQPTCSYTNDGKVTFTFDRDLITGERLDLKLIQIVNGNDLPAIEKTLTQSDFPDRKATYDGLGSGTYYLHYQTFQDNGSTVTSDNRSPQFDITAPPAFSYELKDTAVSCTNGNDGTIAIKILTGVGPYKFYQDGIQVFPELNTGKYYLKGLSEKAGGYEIKVTGNECIEKTL